MQTFETNTGASFRYPPWVYLIILIILYTHIFFNCKIFFSTITLTPFVSSLPIHPHSLFFQAWCRPWSVIPISPRKKSCKQSAANKNTDEQVIVLWPRESSYSSALVCVLRTQNHKSSHTMVLTILYYVCGAFEVSVFSQLYHFTFSCQNVSLLRSNHRHRHSAVCLIGNIFASTHTAFTTLTSCSVFRSRICMFPFECCCDIFRL